MTTPLDLNLDDYQYGFSLPEDYAFKSRKGLDEQLVREISLMKKEPAWMTEFRLRAYRHFVARPMPTWGGHGLLKTIDFNDIYYYIKPTDAKKAYESWDDVPTNIKNTFDRLGIPEAERKFLAGVGAQYESEMVYHSIIESLTKQGVLFLDMDAALREYPEIVRQYFGTVIPPEDNKFAALNTAVWSGGSFIYVPPGVHVDLPLQAYFRINAQNMGQFERTLIIVDEGAFVHYTEGCFLAGTQIRTRQGEKPIEQVKIGDEVLTHLGRYRQVYHVMERPYQGSIYHMQYFGDSSSELRVTGEHPLLAVRRQRAESRNSSFEPEWLKAEEVRPGDYLAIPIPKPESKSNKDVHKVTVPVGRGRHAPVMTDVSLPMEPDFFRLLGYYYAEGHVEQEHYLTFSFNVNETTYLSDTRELINRYFDKDPIESKPRLNGQTLTLSLTPIARAFAYEFGSTVADKHIPEMIKDAPPEHLAELIRGMWCGDGSYDTKNNKFRYNTVSKELAYTFRDTLLKLGIVASINYQERTEPRQDMYTVFISTPGNAKFGQIVGQPAANGSLSGSPFFLDDNYMYVPIRSIEIEEMATTVYNFSVEEDESYVAEGVAVHNCTAPTYSTNSLHSAVVEIIVKQNGRCRYSTVQNWSHNVFNLVTKRAQAFKNATMEWVDGNIGSRLTMKYPAVWLMEEGAHGEVLSIAFAGKGQIQDAGAKIVHAAPNTSSVVTSKSISKHGGRTTYRGLIKVAPNAHHSKSSVVCDALILDELSASDTFPSIEIEAEDVSIGHEASVSKVSEEQLFYLMSRGIPEEQAANMIVSGFIEPIVKELPIEYALEMNRLIEMEMEGAVG